MDPLTEVTITNFGAKCVLEATEYMTRRVGITKRWMSSNNAYMGVYDFPIPKDQSQLYPKFTRIFVAAAMGKVLEVMLPTNGDDPWAIGPTPIPDLGPIQVQDGQTIDPTSLIRMANQAAGGMTRRIRDNMVEMAFDSNLLDATFDLALRGTMAWIGPVKSIGTGTRWIPSGDEMVQAGEDASPRPAFYHVPLLQVYPDPFASKVEDCFAINVRHVIGKPSLFRMSKDPSYLGDVILEYMQQHPRGDWTPALDGWEGDIKNASDQPENNPPQNRYIVWERYGWAEGADLQESGLLPAGKDPAGMYMCQTWHLAGRIIRHDIADYYEHPPFILTPYEKIDGSIFGRGVPEQMDDPQSASASLCRAMIDNLAHGVAPIVEADMDLIDPRQAEKLTKITPRMLIMRRQKHPEVNNPNPAVRYHDVPVHMDIILPALGFFKELMQLQTSLPFATQNLQNQASGIRTIGQQQEVSKSMDKFIRLVITNIDQKFLVPMLNGFYKWEMNYNKDGSIKGDFRVRARGVQGALAREAAVQRKMEMMQISAQNPVLARQLNVGATASSVLRDMGFEDEGLFYTPAEMQQIAQQEATDEARKASMVEQAKYKAAAPVTDLLVQMATSAKPTENPAWPAMAAKAYESIGALTPQIDALLSGMAEAEAKRMLAQGVIDMRQATQAAQNFGSPTATPLISPDEGLPGAPAATPPTPEGAQPPPEPQPNQGDGTISPDEGLNPQGGQA